MNFIVAVDKKWGIGKNNDLLFSLRKDMKHFRETTTGKTVIMGDVTLLSLPGSKPLPNRKNIVLSLDPDFNCDGTVICHSLEELSEQLKSEDKDNCFVIGGASIYKLLMPYCEYAYITKVDADGGAEKFVPNLDELDNWEIVSTSEEMEDEGYTIKFVNYRNKTPKEL